MKIYFIPIVLFLMGMLIISSSFSETKDNADLIKLNKTNTVSISGPITIESVNKIQINLLKLISERGNKNYPIYLVLNTPGGSIFAGIALIELIKPYKNIKTLTLSAASMGAMLVQVVDGERLALESSTLMFHRPSVQVGGQFNEGEVESRLNYLKIVVQKLIISVAKRLTLTYEEYQVAVKDEYWLYGQELIVNNAIDRIVTAMCEDDLIEEKLIEKIKSFFGDIEVEKSACPLIVGE